MKRIIDGKAYNTTTATHVASAEDRYDENPPGSGHVLGTWVSNHGLYRTKGGAFFLTSITRFEPGLDAKFDAKRLPSDRQKLLPLSYDQAHTFVLGREQRVLGACVPGLAVELLEGGIFPTIPNEQEARR